MVKYRMTLLSVFMIFLVLLSGCESAMQSGLFSGTKIKDIIADYSKFENKNVTLNAIHQGYASRYNSLLNHDYKYVVFEDKDGYQIDALLDIKNKDYVGREYKIKGTIKTLELCQCMIQDKFFIRLLTMEELMTYGNTNPNIGTEKILNISDWYKYQPTSQYNPEGGVDDLPQLNGLTFSDICIGKKTSHPYTTKKIPADTTFWWIRYYKCGEPNKEFYYLHVYDLETS
ncbi:hypothetical protein HYU07_00750 [Candidatus Woesearchaeota archaeon]|nr:hypothetical protein [Candidatus Woesearchaeota archaeon]